MATRMGGCERCTNPDAESRDYEITKGGVTAGQRQLCATCATLTAETYTLSPQPQASAAPEADSEAQAAADEAPPRRTRAG